MTLQLHVCLQRWLPYTHTPLSQSFVIFSAPCDYASRGTPWENCNCAAFLFMRYCTLPICHLAVSCCSTLHTLKR